MVYMMCNCTAIGAEFGDARPLDEARMRAMAVNGIQLLDLIDSNDAFLSELASPTAVSYTHLTLPTILRV